MNYYTPVQYRKREMAECLLNTINPVRRPPINKDSIIPPLLVAVFSNRVNRQDNIDGIPCFDDNVFTCPLRLHVFQALGS